MLTRLSSGRCLNLLGGGGLCSQVEAASAAVTSGASPRVLPQPASNPTMQLCGLDLHDSKMHPGLQIVGQRCNMIGSSLFKGLIESYRFTKQGSRWKAALEVCVQQCEHGAQLLDFNLDSDLVDGRWAISKFLRMCASDPNIAKVPYVLSSSTWAIIEEGLKNVPGKCIVNAISLAHGEPEFLRLAKACLRYGAAVVVMAVESPSEVARYQDKVRICQLSYRLLRTKLDFPAEDILFDCNIVPVGAHDASPDGAAEFIEAIAEIKRTCPGVSFIGGLSNLSLPYRGLGLLRSALHSVFLQHAIRSGLNFAIAEPGKLPRCPDLEASTSKLCEEVILNSSADGQHLKRLDDFVSFLRGSAADVVAVPSEVTLQQQALPLALFPQSIRPSPSFRRPLETLVQATGTINASLFQSFGSKAHAANNFHRMTLAVGLKRSVLFSSISAYMGQGGSGPVPGASSFLDALALWERHQGLNGQPITVQWGAIGEIGLRRAVYGSRDVFAQFDLGQKLIGPADTQMLERAVMTGSSVPEFLGMAYLDQTWQNTLGGVVAGGGGGGGGGLEGRNTFADL